MKEFLFGILYLVVVIIVLRFVGRALIKWVYLPLVKFCDKRGLDSSPWGFVIWEALLVYEYLTHTGYQLFFQYWKLTRWMSEGVYGWVLLGLIALPLVVMLIKTRVIYFVPLLLAKLLGIPFLIIAFLCGMPEMKEDLQELEYDEHGLRGFKPWPTNYGPAPQSGPAGRGDSGEGPGHSGSDQSGLYWADPDSGGSSTPESSDPRPSQDGYRQFDAQGEYREYDSDYHPMD